MNFPNVSFKNIPKVINRVSKLFQPSSIPPKDAEIKRQEPTSKSLKLMLELGIIKQANPGCFHLLPLGVKSLEKLERLVDDSMQGIGGQKVIFPTLTSAKIWEQTGRLKTVNSELFKVQDRHNHDYILSPTHEEAATELIASIAPISYKQLPLKLYQITNKYRDEMKPRFGLMRGRQFLMKDLYSFDTDLESAKESYEEICECYNSIFTKLGIDFYKVLGDSGHMGGNLSHEYHYKAEIGEDRIITCTNCGYSANIELANEEKCVKCENSIEISTGIEVGHTFLLGEKYSKPLGSTFLSKEGKPKTLQMGSYGLGLSRILAAALEVLSSEHELRWPPCLAPYSIIVIPPKSGSKEEAFLKTDSLIVERLYDNLEMLEGFKNNILIDDRTFLTIGRRLLEAKRMGYPLIITLGNKIIGNPPLFEVLDINKNSLIYLEENALVSYINQNMFTPPR